MATPGAPAFTPEQVERSRRYHRPLYLAFVLDVALTVAILGILAFGRPGDALLSAIGGLSWWAATAMVAAAVVVGAFLLRLPLSLWRGYWRERRWGFSTQRLSGWAADRAKALAVTLLLTTAAMLALVTVARLLPSAWPLVIAPGGAVLVLVLSFVSPLLLEPLFNRFRRLEDRTLAGELHALSRRAEVPVRDVLVADASRRTRKENAYVSGLGRTRRVVLYDTLLARADPAQVRLVVAHELGHRRLRHVARATVVAMAGMVLGVGLVWLLLETDAMRSAVGATGAADPRAIPFVLFVGTVLQAITMPIAAAISRRWERAADEFSLRLTEDPETFVRVHHDLALANLSDLDPPRIVYAVAFTHPSAPERVAMGRAWGRLGGVKRPAARSEPGASGGRG